MRFATLSLVWVALLALVPSAITAQARPLVTSRPEVAAVIEERGIVADRVLRRFRGARQLRNVTTSEARSIFDVQLVLALLLVQIDPEPGDADGAVRRWDRLARNVEQFTYFPPTTSRHDCVAPEVRALIGTTGQAIGELRRQLFDGANLEEHRRVLLARLAARRRAADRAADRRARGLSCEDLPNEFVSSRPILAETEGLWWSTNVAMFGEAALPELRSAGEREAATILPAVFDALAAATPDEIISFPDRGVLSATPSCGGQHVWTQEESAIWGLVGFAPPRSTWLGYRVLLANPGTTVGDLPAAFVVYAEGDPSCDDTQHQWRLEIARRADGGLVAGPVERLR